VARWALRLVAIGYLGALLAAPVVLIFYRAFQHGWDPFWAAIHTPAATHALRLTLEVALISVPANAIFGVLCALWIVRRPGRVTPLVSALVDLPLALSPVVVGLSLLLLYGRGGWFYDWLTGRGHQVVFATPAIVLATIFVSLPFVTREVVPLLREIGTEQDQAAWTLGASPLATFWRVTLPAIRPAVAYGVVLTTARCLGEFGAVSVVSGNIQNRTQTLTLYVEDRYTTFDLTGTYAISVLLASLAIATLVIANLRKPAFRRERTIP
jgi:sulfate/thiosulfate transport system permease protein